MLSGKLKSGSAVVEAFSKVIPSETAGVMALLAPHTGSQTLENALVPIHMAAVTAAEWQSFKDPPGGTAGDRYLPVHAGGCDIGLRVTLLAGNLPMHPSEMKLCAGMVESRGRFPGIRRMAGKAVRAQLISVRLPMACGALPAQTQEGPVEIFNFDFCAGCRIDSRR